MKRRKNLSGIFSMPFGVTTTIPIYQTVKVRSQLSEVENIGEFRISHNA